jgi:hypothetical protein
MKSPKLEMQNPTKSRSRNGQAPAGCPAGFSDSGLGGAVVCLLAALLLMAWPASGVAQHSIDWSTLDGGGGASTGGVYAVAGTIGQPDAGTMTGGNFALAGGFWGIVAAIQVPGTPPLSIKGTNGAVTLSWPTAPAGFSLEQTSSLTGSRNAWTPVPTGQYQTNSTEVVVVVPVTPENMFFRLRKP